MDQKKKWRRGDFAPRMEKEEHEDVLMVLLDALRARENETMFMWVKAHAGDPGNEAADVQAGAGCFNEVTLFERTTEPLIMFKFEDQTMITKQGWTHSVEKHSRLFEGGITAEHLRHTSEAMSTDSLLKVGVGREMLGRVLKDKHIPERVVRDLL